MKLRGTVQGHSIVFDQPIDLPEGQQVIAEVHPVPTPEELAQYGIHSFPPGGYSETNDMVNDLRDEMDI